MEELSRSEWSDWRQNYATRSFLAQLMMERELIKDAIVDGTYGIEKEALIAIGRARQIRDVVEFILDKSSKENVTNEVESDQLYGDSEAGEVGN